MVFVSSGGMYSATLDADDMESAAGDYEGIRAYARTKRMQVVLAEAWAERLGPAPTSASRACIQAWPRPRVSPNRYRPFRR